MLAQVLARTLGPLLVADAHLLRRARVILVELVQHRFPVVGAAQLAGAARQLLGQLVVGSAAALAQLAGVEAEELLLPQQGAVPLLPDRPLAGGARTHLLEERDVVLVRRSGGLAGFGQPRAQRPLVHLRGQNLPNVARS